MRFVLITGDDLEHRYVANRLAAEIDLTAILVDRGKQTSFFAKCRRQLRRYSATEIVSKSLLRIFKILVRDKRAYCSQLEAVLGEENCHVFKYPNLVEYISGVNSKRAVETVKNLKPDVILIYGTGIVKNKVLTLAKMTRLNMHTGLSPYYRGCDCTLWPIHNGEPEMVGATVHECTQQVDGGKVFGIRKARLEGDDQLHTVFARAVVAGTDLYIEVVRSLAAGERLEGQEQDLTVGKEYRASMRGLGAELRVRRLIKKGLICRLVASQQYHHSVRRASSCS